MSDLHSLIGQQFAYAFGRTGVLRLLLLEQSDVDRLLGAHSLNEAEKILTELKLTNVIDQGISEGSAILKALGSWMRAEVNQMSPKSFRPTFQILWLEGDAPLLSYLLKQRLNLNSVISREPASGISAYDPEALRTLVLEGAESSLPSHLISFVKDIKEKEGLTPRDVDTAVAQFVAKTQRALAKTSGSEGIRRFVSHRIDLQNIRTALRLSMTDEDALPFLLEGGSIAPKELNGSPEDIAKAVAKSPLGIVLPSDIEKSFADPIEFEQNAAHVIATDIADMWNVPMSIEPLFAFAAITMSQLKLIRTILIAKGNEISPQDTKRMLPPFLSASSYLT